jgi:hypothetical protein
MSSKRKPLDDAFEKRFVFGESAVPTPPPPESPKLEPTGTDNPTPKVTPWSDMEATEREPTIRLNVDIPLSLNDKLAEKARRLRKPKTELVRRLLEWALDESSE